MEPPSTTRDLALYAAGTMLSLAIAYLAGRNRWLAKTLRSITDAYEQLVTRLSGEIDRLHARVKELEDLTRPLRPRRGATAAKVPHS